MDEFVNSLLHQTLDDNSTSPNASVPILFPDKSTLPAISAALVSNSVLGLFGLLLFSLLRGRFQLFYAPKLEVERKYAPPEIANGLFTWIPSTLRASNQETLKQAGLDGIVFLDILRHIIKLLSLICVISTVILLPMHANGSNNLSGLIRFTLANVDQNSDLLWVNTLLLYIFSGMTCYTIDLLWRKFIARKQAFIADFALPQFYTLMVTDLPDSLKTDEELTQYYRKFYHDVSSAHVVKDLSELHEFVKMKRKLERQIRLMRHHGRDLLNPLPCIFATESLGKLYEQLHEINNCINALRTIPHRPYPVGFVSFRSLVSLQQALRAVHHTEPWVCLSNRAPAPTDLCRFNLGISRESQAWRWTLAYILTCAIIFFWSIPVAFVSSLTTLNSLGQRFAFMQPVVEWLVIHPDIKAFVEGYLSTLVLIMFFYLVPTILEGVTRLQGVKSYSEMQRSVMTKYFIFQVINVILVFQISATVFETLGTVLDSPLSVIEVIGSSFPRASGFYICYALFKGIGGLPFDLLRISGWLLHWISTSFAHMTIEEKLESSNKLPGFAYGSVGTDVVILFTLALIYATIAPLVVPFVLAYFLLGYLTWKYQLIYVSQPRWDSAGRFQPKVITRLLIGLFLAQFTFLAVALLKQAYVVTAFVLPLMILTIVFWIRSRTAYKDLSEILPLGMAIAIDDDRRRQMGSWMDPNPSNAKDGAVSAGMTPAGKTVTSTSAASTIASSSATTAAGGGAGEAAGAGVGASNPISFPPLSSTAYSGKTLHGSIQDLASAASMLQDPGAFYATVFTDEYEIDAKYETMIGMQGARSVSLDSQQDLDSMSLGGGYAPSVAEAQNNNSSDIVGHARKRYDPNEEASASDAAIHGLGFGAHMTLPVATRSADIDADDNQSTTSMQAVFELRHSRLGSMADGSSPASSSRRPSSTHPVISTNVSHGASLPGSLRGNLRSPLRLQHQVTLDDDDADQVTVPAAASAAALELNVDTNAMAARRGANATYQSPSQLSPTFSSPDAHISDIARLTVSNRSGHQQQQQLRHETPIPGLDDDPWSPEGPPLAAVSHIP